MEFRNGRKEVIFPERFTADIPATGTCFRTQARLPRIQSVCAAEAPCVLLKPSLALRHLDAATRTSWKADPRAIQAGFT